MDDDNAFLDWFAGFVAADGCFHSVVDKGVRPRFTVHLRWDDVDILLEIQGRLGIGKIYRKPSYRPQDMPAAEFQVSPKAQLGKLVRIFDQHPIRAKKQRDYNIWREMVHIYQQALDVRDQERLRHLHNKLRFVKQYSAGEYEDFARQGPEQLELEI